MGTVIKIIGKIKALYKQRYKFLYVEWAMKTCNNCIYYIILCFIFCFTTIQNELKEMLRVLPPTNQTCLATNQVVASCVNTDF